ncbi:MAG TPA: response regulator transcription factor [Gemmatimonadales bacterium]|jgi:Response regulator containing a CheY-like receiver domain and an HTH DNA-binding domain
MHRTRVIIADDHTMFRQGLAYLLPPEMDLVATVADGRELVEAIRRLQPDVVVADVTMPELGGLEALRIVRQERLHARFIILTVHADPSLAAEALRAGAMAYVVKQAAGEELVEALRLAVANRTYLSPLVSGDVVRRLVEGATSPGETLTGRQREVLRLLAEGRRVKEIALQLGLSVRTVETHKYEIMHALEIDNTADLVRFAIRRGLVTA